jgi:hypothetical protein
VQKLPDITIVCIDCILHDLTRLALLDTLEQISPAETLIFSDREIYDAPGVKWVKTSINSKDKAFETLWHVAPNFVETSHYLHIEWDGWVLNGDLWQDSWLDYDYIGAPWPWHPNFRVGNGGFSLRSLHLARFLQAHAATYPIIPPEDDTLCRTYRPTLEDLGFRWAPELVATAFSLEHGPLHPTFGFHDCRNWPRLLSPTAAAHRTSLAAANLHTRSHPARAALST